MTDLRKDYETVSELIRQAGTRTPPKLHDVSLADQALERLWRALRVATTCGCGAPRSLGDCPNFCERPV